LGRALTGAAYHDVVALIELFGDLRAVVFQHIERDVVGPAGSVDERVSIDVSLAAGKKPVTRGAAPNQNQ
jgi:hypothetical protein